MSRRAGIGQDWRLAARALLRNRTYTLVAAITIAVGVGATTAVLSIANVVLLRPPPIPEPDRMGSIWELTQSYVESMEGRLLPYARYQAYRDATTDVFSGLAGHRYEHLSLRTDAGAVAVDGFLTSGNYFAVLGLAPSVGQLYNQDEEAVVVLSRRLWLSRFNGDRSVIGTTVSIDGRGFQVAGVAPAGFVGTMTAFTGDLWIPLEAYRRLTGITGQATWVVPIGRFRPGINRDRVAARVDQVARLVPRTDTPAPVRGALLERLDMRTDVLQLVGAGIAMLGGAAILLLLIASANVAGMILARSYDRQREVTVRLAIGANRGRIVRQQLTESLLLFLIGGTGGVLLAVWGTRLLSAIRFPVNATITVDATPSVPVLLFGLVLAAGTGILFGLGPALRSSRVELATALKEGQVTGPRSVRRRSIFLVGQIAVATLLVVVAGLFVRSWQELLDVPLGFVPDHVLVTTLDLEAHGYDQARGRAFYDQLIERVRALPGVQAAALGEFVPAGGASAAAQATAVEAGVEDPPHTSAFFNIVDPAYLNTMRVELLAGRWFTAEDRAGAPLVAVVNQALAERLWPGQNALGKRFRSGGGEHEVIGVVRDGVHRWVSEPHLSFSYYPFAQHYRPAMSLHVRATASRGEIVGQIGRVVRELDPDVALQGTRTMPEVLAASTFFQRFAARLTALFGAIGLLLAALGVYGLLAVHVAQRRREFGIRMALGARAADVLVLVAGRGLGLALIGCALGLLLAFASARLLASLLFGISPFDAITFLAAPGVFLAVALLASMAPARRATHSDPLEVLRQL